MRLKKFLCMAFSCVIAISCVCLNVNAAGAETFPVYSGIERASGRFTIDNIPGNTMAVAGSDLPLEIGETVSINASYSPRSASVDFGLIAPDGLFYPFRAQNGRFDKTIEVNQRGNYSLAIRNNSNFEISVTGFVTY